MPAAITPPLSPALAAAAARLLEPPLDSAAAGILAAAGISAAAAAVEAASEAASGGEAASAAASAPRYEARDVSRALLIMISNNIGQLAYLNAQQHRCKDIYFAGNFLRHENTVAMRTLAYSIRFWSKGTMDGLFLRHEGYCGALGAFLETMTM